MKTLLVIRSSAMGDVAMAAPIVEEVARTYGSEVRQVVLTPKFHNPFFINSEGIEFFDIELKGRHKGICGVYRLFKELKKAYRFDAVIDLHDKLYSKFLTLLFRCSKVPTYTIDKGRAEKKALTRRESRVFKQLKTSFERYADVFRAAGYSVEVPIKLRDRAVRPIPEFAGTKTERWIGIAPFAKHKGKRLPLQRVREVIEAIEKQEPTARIFIFGGGSEERMISESLVGWYSNCTSAIGMVRLNGEMDLMASLDVMLSMDSSAMHLCSLLGVRVVSVWGATHQYAGFLGLGQSEDDIVSIDMECRPCSIFGNKECHRGDYACLERIETARIVELLLK